MDKLNAHSELRYANTEETTNWLYSRRQHETENALNTQTGHKMLRRKTKNWIYRQKKEQANHTHTQGNKYRTTHGFHLHRTIGSCNQPRKEERKPRTKLRHKRPDFDSLTRPHTNAKGQMDNTTHRQHYENNRGVSVPATTGTWGCFNRRSKQK